MPRDPQGSEGGEVSPSCWQPGQGVDGRERFGQTWLAVPDRYHVSAPVGASLFVQLPLGLHLQAAGAAGAAGGAQGG